MSTSLVAAGDDPRDASAEAPLSLPETWQTESLDPLSTSVVFLSGLIMVSRNRYLAWPTLLLSMNSVINQHPLRTKEGSQGTWSTLSMSVLALVMSYSPMFMVSPPKAT